jgi:hypothetical protein
MVWYTLIKIKERRTREMMKRREFTDRKEAGKFFYGINKMSTVAYKSLNAKTKTYIVEWIWDKEYFKKNK